MSLPDTGVRCDEMGAFTDVHLGKCGAAFFDHFLDLTYVLKDYCISDRFCVDISTSRKREGY